MSKLKLQVVIASTRPGRVGKPVADWFTDHARKDDRFEVEVADLAEINLPFLDELKHPALQQYEHQHTRDWSARIAGSDAFVFVEPEYNYSMCAPLKNALDYLVVEWADKPAAIVSYGGISAGLRAAEHSKQTMTALQMMVVKPAISIPMVSQMIKGGQFQPTEIVEKSVKPLLNDLYRWGVTLKDMREKK
ncbi:NADPH-dependent oxidoreductase [Deinococcus cavernae]|uniref:NADPH-dependent oxidoreductase n=1 Tax=Deinococcus cavernae TaxID=2320857 RepID=A0A418V9P1_9DEIO|nr:NAD(P)H-dependent oxidoreductase [Deinococcus cavernae]RJF72838.1 NADPH-dependent oxidoreductase [Deinococcus cavernae]